MKNFEFKSQICTSRSQSEKLLALGLKPETADMMYITDKNVPDEYRLYRLIPEYDEQCPEYLTHIPAWSLHRLLSLLPTEIKCDVENGLGIYLGSQNDVSYFGVLGYYSCENLYDAVILCIEDVIKEGYFNQDYLEDKL